MEYAIGLVLGFGVLLSSTLIGLDRERAFYPTVMTVIASYYGLFAVMGGSTPALLQESVAIAGFVALAVVGLRINLWWVVAALAAHGLFDFVHGYLIADPGVPRWWPGWCLTFDLVVAAYLARLLSSGRLPVTPTPEARAGE